MTTYMGRAVRMAAADDVFGGDLFCCYVFPKSVLVGMWNSMVSVPANLPFFPL